MYDTDMFEPLAIGNWTLKADVSDDSRTKNRSGPIGAKVARGKSTAIVAAAVVMTATMYHRACGGRSLSKVHSSITLRGKQLSACQAFNVCPVACAFEATA
jgi:hypothetical protein